jgi:hypothetical protein
VHLRDPRSGRPTDNEGNLDDRRNQATTDARIEYNVTFSEHVRQTCDTGGSSGCDVAVFATHFVILTTGRPRSLGYPGFLPTITDELH